MKTVLTNSAVEALKFAGISEQTFSELDKMYQEPHRFYHNYDHILDLMNKIDSSFTVDIELKNQLILVALFHDCIYDINSKTNEIDSANLFLKFLPDTNFKFKNEVYNAICETSNHIATTEMSNFFL